MKPAPGLDGSQSWDSPRSPQRRTLPVGSRCMWMATTGVRNAGSHRPSSAAPVRLAGMKPAGTVCPWITVSWQVPLPAQGAPQPENTCPGAGVAVSVSAVLAGYRAEQPAVAGVPSVIVQSIAGVSPACDFTVPLPGPAAPEIFTVKGPLRNRA